MILCVHPPVSPVWGSTVGPIPSLLTDPRRLDYFSQCVQLFYLLDGGMTSKNMEVCFPSQNPDCTCGLPLPGEIVYTGAGVRTGAPGHWDSASCQAPGWSLSLPPAVTTCAVMSSLQRVLWKCVLLSVGCVCRPGLLDS